MPIRLQSVTPQAGAISTSLAALSSNFDGSSSAPSAFTGTMRPRLTGFASAVMLGEFTANSDRTGTVASTLSGVTGAFTDQTAPYNLNGLTNIAWTPVWPTVPVTSQTINVSSGNESALRSACATSGARVVVAAGTYNLTQTLSFASDVDLVGAAGVRINGGGSFSGVSRVRMTSVDWYTGSDPTVISVSGCTDILWNDIYLNGRCEALNPGTHRFALINSTVAGASQTNGYGDYLWFISATTSSDTPGNSARHQDWIHCNVRFENSTGNGVNRFQWHDRLLCYQCIGNGNQSAAGPQAFRVGQASDNVHLEEYALFGRAFTSFADANRIQVTNFRMQNCTMRPAGQSIPAWVTYHSSNPPNTGVVEGCTPYLSASGGFGGRGVGESVPMSPNMTDGGNDTIQAYNPSAEPNPDDYGKAIP